LKIENRVIIPEIEDNLIWKHGVFRYEVEEDFENRSLFRFEKNDIILKNMLIQQ
jgi:hypothetical protein